MIDYNLISILEKIALILEIKGENPFKARAYKNAAELIISENLDLESLVKENKLSEIPGFGDALVKKITDYYTTGKIEYYEKLKEDVPESLLELTKIALIGPRKAADLFYNHNIKNLQELENACKKNELSKIKGFSAKSQDLILNSVEHKKAGKGRFNQEHSIQDCAAILNSLNKQDFIQQAGFTSEYRRFTETVKDFYIIVESNDFEKASKFLISELDLLQNENIFQGKTKLGIDLTIEICNSDNFHWRLNRTTGSDEYLSRLDKVFLEKNYSISEHSCNLNGNQIIFKNEEDIYREVDLQYIHPEIRETPEVIEKAAKNELKPLIKLCDLKGMIHVHSNWSDGKSTIRNIALECKKMGFEYLAICDHSESARYANGLTDERILEQFKEIYKLNEEGLGIHILKGIEADINKDGSLDNSESVLSQFDVVVASIHSSFNLSKKEMTKRLVYALMSPYTTILGHPTGRLLLVRKGYEVDMDEVIQAAADYGKAIEINSNPYRLDLSWENCLKAKEKGVKLSINPDSHRLETLTDVFYGIRSARKAFIEKDDVINCLDYNDFMKTIVKKSI